MKKTLIAAALLAGFAGAAHAQTNVTLYGRVDAGLVYNNVKVDKNYIDNVDNIFGSNKKSGSHIGMISGRHSGSRWGLRGSEDLGDGLRAVFNLESGFSLRDGRSAQGTRLFGRQATLGLASDSWGMLEFGRQLTMANKYFGDIDPFGTSFGHASMDHSFSAAGVRYDNLVLYRTPEIEGFQLGVGYSFATNNNNAEYKTGDNTRALTVGLRYLNGPLNVVATYDEMRRKRDGTLAAPNDTLAKPKMYGLGATYDFEVVKLAAAYARTSDGWFDGAAGLPEGLDEYPAAFAKGFKANSYLLGLTAPIADGSKVFTSWQRIKPKNDKLTGLTGTRKNDETSNVYSAGYTYDFSKRTNLYSYATYTTNFAFIKNVKSTEVGVGLRHIF